MRKEEKKKQDTFLEKIYKEKMKEIEENEGTDDDMDWDPIEDEFEDGRGNFIGMLIFTLRSSMNRATSPCFIICISRMLANHA